MSYLPRRPLYGALLAACALALAGASPASAADQKLELTGVYAGPVGPAAEVLSTNPSDPVRTYPGGRCGRAANASGVWEAMKPLAAAAGTSTDQCIAFTLPDPDRGTGNTAQSPDLSVTNGDDPRDITLDLPRGFQAQPAGVPTCTAAQFRVNDDGTSPIPTTTINESQIENECPAASQVGAARIQTYIRTDTLKIDDDSIRGKVYHLVPGQGEVARLGIEVPIGGLALPTRSVVKFKITGGDDPRLRAEVKDLPRFAYLLRGSAPNYTFAPQPILINGVGILAWGDKAEHPELGAPFFGQHGTECGVDLSATATVATWKGTTSTKTSAPYRVSGCENLPFAPTVAVSGVERAPGVPTPVTVDVDVPQAAAQPRTSLVKDVTVTLPAGLEVGAQVASGEAGLPFCSAQAFDRAGTGAATCPAGSKVGEARIDSPLVGDPFTGSVYLGPQGNVGELPKLYVEASLAGSSSADAARIKLVGTAVAGDDGRVTATFPNNPQLRFSHIKLSFRGGQHALFITPRACGTTTGSSTVSPSSGGAGVTAPLSLVIDQDCATPAFSPSVGVAPASGQAKATAPTTITIDRPDRSPWLSGVKVSLPSGLLAFLKNAAECDAGAAASGACPESSRIGSVRVRAGAGPAPLTLGGSLYLVQPPAGTVAGAVIVVRAKIGDLDLGNVVVPGRIELRPTDAGLDFVTTAPTRLFNLPLNIRTIDVSLDREAFATNPSSCGPLPYGSQLTGDGGQTASPGGTVTYTGCQALPLQPSLKATLTGDVKPEGFPGMYVEMSTRLGDSNLKQATITLPEGVSAALRNVQVQCDPAAFNAGACPAGTRVGTARANVSITDDTIVGDIFLIKVAGEPLPGLGLSFGGRYTQRVTSLVKTEKSGRLQVIFPAIPDLPITRLVVDVAGGPKGPLQLPDADCPNGTRWDGVFVGQGGQTATAQTGLRCAAPSAMRMSDKSGFSLRNFDFGGRKLKSAKVTVPNGYKLSPSAAKPKGRSWARATGGKAKLKITSKSISVTTTAKNLTTLRVKISGKAVTRTSKKKLKKKATVSVKVRFAFTDGAVQTQTIKAKAG